MLEKVWILISFKNKEYFHRFLLTKVKKNENLSLLESYDFQSQAESIFDNQKSDSK